MSQHTTSCFCWRWGRQAITAMKENVAARTAALDRMKMMWFSAVGENQMNYCFRMEEENECNFYFHDSSSFHFSCYGDQSGQRRMHLHSHFCFQVWNDHNLKTITTTKIWKQLGKKGRPNNNGECLRMYMTTLEKPGRKKKKKGC